MLKFISVLLVVVFSFSCHSAEEHSPLKSHRVENSKDKIQNSTFNPFDKLQAFKQIIKKKNLNIQYVFVVDYSLHSGKKRMYLVDILKHKIVRKMMVAHGAKSETKIGYATDFSNVVESNKSSLGYAIVQGRAYSRWGIHVKYWLDGISKTNSNMRKRVMVLHSYRFVPSFETYPLPIVTSLGCVMLSKKDMRFIDKLIKKQHNKRVLMYIRA